MSYIEENGINFIAIDFETATSRRNSVCELGLVVVENGEITERKRLYFMPPSMYFDDFNKKLLGYDQHTIPDKRYFKWRWREIESYFKSKKVPHTNKNGEFCFDKDGDKIEDVVNKVIVCHNAAFDISCIRETFDIFEMQIPRFDYLCTMQLSRRLFPFLSTHKLNDVCLLENIHLDHHNSLSDAEASAVILLKALKNNNCTNIYELAKKIDMQIGKQYETYYSPCSIYGFRNSAKFKNGLPEKIEFDTAHPFYAKEVVFTGELKTMTRQLAQRLVKNIGGYICGDNLKKTTNYLIDSDESRCSGKNKKADFYNQKGANIVTITEAEFLKMLKYGNENIIDDYKNFLSTLNNYILDTEDV